jgi:hypothetical protein
MYIQVTEHDSYGKLTPEVLSMQSYVSLIGGVKDIRYFGLTDCDAIPRFKNSPFTSENNGYEHGSTYDIVKDFNNGKFKYFKDFIVSKDIDKIDFYRDNTSIYGYIDNIDDFVKSIEGEMILSVDKNREYLFIVNASFEKELKLVTDMPEFIPGSGEQYAKNNNIIVKCGDICILRKPAKKDNIFKRIWKKIINFFKRLKK